MPRLPSYLIVAFAAAGARADTLISGSVIGVLDAARSPYVATANLTVPAGGSLNIAPGVVVRFRDRATLNVYGALTAEGTEAEPITFTADSTLSRGAWGGIGVWENASATLRSFRVRYAGLPGAFTLPGSSTRTAALFVYRGNLTASDGDVRTVGGDAIYYHNDGPDGRTLDVTACSLADAGKDGLEIGALNRADAIAVTGSFIAGNAGYAYRIPAAALNRVGGGNSLSGNLAGDGVAVTGGALMEDAALAPGVPYALLSSVVVPAPWRLTAGPGVTVRFRPAAVLDVRGALAAAGSPASPVTFTADLPPVPWGGIGLSDGAQASLSNAVVQWGGYPSAFPLPGTADYASAAVFAYRASLTMTDVAVVDSAGDGVNWRNDASAPQAFSASGCAITDPANDGIVIAAMGPADAPVVSGCAIAGAWRYPIYAPAGALPGLVNDRVTDNALPLIALSGGELRSDAAIGAGARLRCLAPVTVLPGATLSAGAGALVDFLPGAYLDVFGRLVTLGSAGSPVTFTSAAAAPQPGDWGGVGLEEGASADLAHAAIRYAGEEGAFLVPGLGLRSAGLLVNRASLNAVGLICEANAGDGLLQYNPDPAPRPLSLTGGAFRTNAGSGARFFQLGASDAVTLQGCAFSGNGGNGLEVTAAAQPPVLSGLTSAGNGQTAFRLAASALPGLTSPSMSGNAGGDVVAVRGGTMGAGASVRWPLLLEGTVTVAPNAALLLEAGASVSMGEDVSLLVLGGLTADGTPEHPVRFLAAGGDQTAGHWGGIGFAAGSAGELRNVDVRAAGAFMGLAGIESVQAAIACHDASVSLDGCTLRDGAGALLYLRGDSLMFAARNTTLMEPPAGPHARLVDAAGRGSIVFGGSEAMGCDFISLRPAAVNNAGPAAMAATWCYWNAENGPSPAGTGAGASGPVNSAPYLHWPRNVPLANGGPGSGDLNGNGTVDAGDAALALRLAAGWQAATSRSLAAGDVRPNPGGAGGPGDGRVGLDDAVAIFRQALRPAASWP